MKMKQGICLMIGCFALCVAFAGKASAAVIDTKIPDEIEESYFSKPESNRIAIEDVVPDAEIIYDLPYCGENSTNYQKLHLVLPPNAGEEKRPVLVVVHGGIWSSGNSEEDHRVQVTDQAGLWALNDGYAVALVDYSVKNQENEVALPNQIYEIKAAVRYVRSIADEYNLDSDRIALLGESAGGHLANIVGTTNGDVEYDKEEYGNMEYSSEVQAVIGQYSVGTLKDEADSMLTRLFGVDTENMEKEERTALIEYVSAINHVDENDPPFYLEHGLEDDMVSYTQSCDLYNALIMAGNKRSELHLYPGMNHGVTWFQTEKNAAGFMGWLNDIFEVKN